MTTPLLRQATLSDLDALLTLERSSFAAERQEGVPSIKRSIVSPHQELWVLVLPKTMQRGGEAGRKPSAKALLTASTAVSPAASGMNATANSAPPVLASGVLRIFPKTLRFYSIAVASECRGKGYGQLMLDHMIARARKLGKTTASLEADAANPALLRWYGNNGFEITKRLPDYYGRRQDGVRMHLRL